MNFLPKAAHKMFYKNILYSGVNPWQFVRKTYYSNNEFRDFYITNSSYAKSVFDLPRPLGRGLKRPQNSGL